MYAIIYGYVGTMMISFCTGRIIAWLWYGGLTTVYKYILSIHCIPPLIPNFEKITLKCSLLKIHKSYVQSCLLIVYLCCIVIVFENSREKLLGYSYFWFVYRMGHAPLRSSVYTITRSSKTHSINFLLQHTGKMPLNSYCTIRKHCHVLVRIITWCGNPWHDYDAGSFMWLLMVAVLRKNGHHKEGSTIKL